MAQLIVQSLRSVQIVIGFIDFKFAVSGSLINYLEPKNNGLLLATSRQRKPQDERKAVLQWGVIVWFDLLVDTDDAFDEPWRSALTGQNSI